ncbi:hypothetical protein N339_05696, partial [Pterocles gutturalis]
GALRVKVPLSLSDLISLKKDAGEYRENPEKVSKVFEMVIRKQDPDWNEIQVVLDTLLSETEKEMVLAKAKEEAERLHLQGAMEGTVWQNFPSTNPEWDPNEPESRALLTQYQKLIVFGMKHAIPKATNWSKLYEVKQDKEESPSKFYE